MAPWRQEGDPSKHPRAYLAPLASLSLETFETFSKDLARWLVSCFQNFNFLACSDRTTSMFHFCDRISHAAILGLVNYVVTNPTIVLPQRSAGVAFPASLRIKF